MPAAQLEALNRSLQSKIMLLSWCNISNHNIDFGFEEDSPPTTPVKFDPRASSQLQIPPVFDPMPSMPPPATASWHVYQHVRSLSGIVDTLFSPPKPDDTPVPSLGPLAMAYLRAHGYDISSILHIYASYQKSSTADDFAQKLSLKGLPFTEGKYIWEIIRNGQPAELSFN